MPGPAPPARPGPPAAAGALRARAQAAAAAPGRHCGPVSGAAAACLTVDSESEGARASDSESARLASDHGDDSASSTVPCSAAADCLTRVPVTGGRGPSSPTESVQRSR